MSEERHPFAELGLAPALVEAVARAGYVEPTEIQRQAIPAILAGHDVLGTAHTGTGKTAAFTLPAVQRLAATEDSSAPRGLVVTPTRELAQQVGAAVTAYGGASSIEAVIIHGGTPLGPEKEELAFGCDILIATPGRLLDHLKRGNADLSRIEVLVLDEADRMLDMGFIDDVKEIVRRTPADRQTLLFSATMPDGVRWLARELMTDPEEVKVGRETAAEGIRQVLHPVDWSQKQALLHHLLETWPEGQVLVFTRTRVTATYLADYLRARDVSVAGLHGGKHQDQRDKALRRFREGTVRVLVATNVAARGLDILGIRHVVNFDVPEDPRDYVHRVGRTARGDDTGDAVTLMASSDWVEIRAIERLLGESIERRAVPGFEPDVVPPPPEEEPVERPEPSALRRGIRRRR
ncbi:DEAD/DEAH box helicase [Candidatus Palauibacter sp.]|uniref:DEAD/DEAH box helicase n=1 Tax=Candidatus Palauibacter sp. TaxID=3101350 RepID=UPI003B51AA84